MTTDFSDTEAQRLDEISTRFSTHGGFEGRLIDYGYRSIEPFMTGKACLELGPADGQMTQRLLERFDTVTAVDGSSAFCEQLRERYRSNSGLTVTCSLFEDFETTSRFDTLVAAHVLEHVEEPQAVLKRTLQWTAPGGRLIVQVPNARSIHRMLGVKLGQLGDTHELNERDHEVGHRRVYDAESLRIDVEAAGWHLEQIVGSYFKVFSNDQSEQWFSEELIQGFFELGQEFPEHGTMIAAICRAPA